MWWFRAFIRCDPYSESYNVAGAGNKYADADGKAEYENGKGRPFKLSVTESRIAWGVLFFIVFFAAKANVPEEALFSSPLTKSAFMVMGNKCVMSGMST